MVSLLTPLLRLWPVLFFEMPLCHVISHLRSHPSKSTPSSSWLFLYSSVQYRWVTPCGQKPVFMSADSVFTTELDILISAWLLGMLIRNQYSHFDGRLGCDRCLIFEREYLCAIWNGTKESVTVSVEAHFIWECSWGLMQFSTSQSRQNMRVQGTSFSNPKLDTWSAPAALKIWCFIFFFQHCSPFKYE